MRFVGVDYYSRAKRIILYIYTYYSYGIKPVPRAQQPFSNIGTRTQLVIGPRLTIFLVTHFIEDYFIKKMEILRYLNSVSLTNTCISGAVDAHKHIFK